MLEIVWAYFQEERAYKWKNVEAGKKSRNKENEEIYDDCITLSVTF